jgi:hypothetical protein
MSRLFTLSAMKKSSSSCSVVGSSKLPYAHFYSTTVVYCHPPLYPRMRIRSFHCHIRALALLLLEIVIRTEDQRDSGRPCMGCACSVSLVNLLVTNLPPPAFEGPMAPVVNVRMQRGICHGGRLRGTSSWWLVCGCWGGKLCDEVEVLRERMERLAPIRPGGILRVVSNITRSSPLLPFHFFTHACFYL